MNTFRKRTLIIGDGYKLSSRQGQIRIQNGETARTVPLYDVQAVLITSPQSTLTASLIEDLAKRKIRLVLCGKDHLPYGEFVGHGLHHASAGKLKEQILWESQQADRVWREIVSHKLAMQKKLLILLSLQFSESRWTAYHSALQNGDRTNREAMAARVYFNTLFGKGFQRRKATPANAALNYGYAVLCSLITQTLTAHGYHPGLGIHHSCRTNRWNLTYDLMEPFRPFADRVVFHSQEEFSRETRRLLADLPNASVLYGGRTISLTEAADRYVLEITEAMKERRIPKYEMDFVA